MFKDHYEKVEVPKGDYRRYEGQAGDEYYAHKGEKGGETWKQVAGVGAAIGVVMAAYFYTNA